MISEDGLGREKSFSGTPGFCMSTRESPILQKELAEFSVTLLGFLWGKTGLGKVALGTGIC